MAHMLSWNRNAVKAVAAGLMLLALLALAAGPRTAADATAIVNLWPASPAARPVVPLLRVTEASEVRSGPGHAYLVLATTFPGESLPVLGRSADGGWLRVDVGGRAQHPPPIRPPTSPRLRYREF
jgi:uncharacterized protein YgiM (DUF1202 family)